MKSFLCPLLKAEEEVLKATRKKYSEAFALFDEAQELFIDRVNQFGNAKFDSLSDLQSVRIYLTVRSIKSIRTAKMALLLGYYQQAITLLRMVAENNLAMRDAAIHPPTLQGLSSDIPIGDEGNDNVRIDRFGTMAARQSSEFEQWWRWYYGQLSIYGAHPRKESWAHLGHTNPSNEGSFIIDIMSFFDENRVEPILCIMGAELWRMFETTNELVKDTLRDKTELDQPELPWPQDKLMELGQSLYSLGYDYIFRRED